MTKAAHNLTQVAFILPNHSIAVRKTKNHLRLILYSVERNRLDSPGLFGTYTLDLEESWPWRCFFLSAPHNGITWHLAQMIFIYI